MNPQLNKRAPGLSKVQFSLTEDSWHGFGTEDLWATTNAPGEYTIENTPFFVKGVGYKDVVSATEVNGVLQFDRVLRSNGHSTYRILLNSEASKEEFEEYWSPIEQLGCTYESGDLGYLIWAVDVPAEVDVKEVYRLLDIGEQEDIWGFEEGHFGQTR